MGSTARVFNETRKCYWKRNQANKSIDNCAAAWVIPGIVLRDLTPAESLDARNKQERKRIEKLPWAELPDCIYRWSGHEGYVYAERMRAIEANQFAQLQTP